MILSCCNNPLFQIIFWYIWSTNKYIVFLFCVIFANAIQYFFILNFWNLNFLLYISVKILLYTTDWFFELYLCISIDEQSTPKAFKSEKYTIIPKSIYIRRKKETKWFWDSLCFHKEYYHFKHTSHCDFDLGVCYIIYFIFYNNQNKMYDSKFEEPDNIYYQNCFLSRTWVSLFFW